MSVRLNGVAACRGTLVAAVLLLAGCAGVIPNNGINAGGAGAGGLGRADASRAPSVPAGQRPQRGEQAAAPIPAVPGDPIQAAPPPTDAASALASGVIAGPEVGTLGISTDAARRALLAFRLSCPSVVRRADASGLTRPEDWTAACTAATGWNDDDAAGFFASQFRTVQVGDGRGFATGYYEPEIAGSRSRSARHAVPVYALPDDLVEVDLGQFSTSLAGRRIRGRVEAGRLVPYHDRAAIDAGALANRNLEIAWAADPVEFFFLQVQGSGRLRLPDGSVMRIGYAGQNGRDYVGIGRLLRDRGVLAAGESSMQGIMGYLRRQADGGARIMEENPSFVFFRELTGPGPLGALGVPVTPRGSVAADPAFVPLGAPIFLALDRAEPNGLWIAQDTGGAIRGANRFDTFWGAGDDARAIAGGMSARGAALILLPRASVQRLTGGR